VSSAYKGTNISVEVEAIMADLQLRTDRPSRHVLSCREVPMNVSGGWRLSESFVHSCGDSAYFHPDTNEVWACLKCSVVTDTPSVCGFALRQ